MTDGVAPITNANASVNGIVSPAHSRRRKPLSSPSSLSRAPQRSVKCIPETTMTCESPLSLKSLRFDASSAYLLPSSTLRIKSSTSPS